MRGKLVSLVFTRSKMCRVFGLSASLVKLTWLYLFRALLCGLGGINKEKEQTNPGQTCWVSLGSWPAPGVWFQTGWRRGCGCQMSVIPSSLPFQPPLPPMLMALETQLSESPRGQPVSHCEPQAASCLRLLRILSQAACSVQAQCRCKCGSCHLEHFFNWLWISI